MHDSWIGLCVSNNGGLIIDLDNSSILYRQHNNNVLGARPMASIITKLFNIVTVCKKNYYYYKVVRKAEHRNEVPSGFAILLRIPGYVHCHGA